MSKRQAYRTNKEFTLDSMTELLGKILDENLPIFPKQVDLNLPSLTIPKLKLK